MINKIVKIISMKINDVNYIRYEKFKKCKIDNMTNRNMKIKKLKLKPCIKKKYERGWWRLSYLVRGGGIPPFIFCLNLPIFFVIEIPQIKSN